MKYNLRKEMLSKKNQLTQSDISNKSRAILSQLKKYEYQLKGKNIFIFIDFKKEVMTEPIINFLKTLNCGIYIPRIDMTTKTMDIYPYTSHHDLIESTYGIMEPQADHSKIVSESILDVVITPGVVFDQKGYRIGYGGGYYDKLFGRIGKKVLKIAIGFDMQVVDSVPTDEYDQKVDLLITETMNYKF